MGFFGTSNKNTQAGGPYRDSSTNLIYNLLFCDSPDLFKDNTKEPYTYPFDIIFSASSTQEDFQKVAEDKHSESRVKVLAYNRLISRGQKPDRKELLAVIIEVGLDGGLDVLASFRDGTARYINHTGKMIIWENGDDESGRLTHDLFSKSEEIVKRIGPWDKPRRPHPTQGMARITFLVSDGFYFGEGPINALFNDPLASPALTSGAELMRYLTETALRNQK